MIKDLDPTLRLLCEGSSDIFFIANFKNLSGLEHLKPTGEPTSDNLDGQGESYVFKQLPKALGISGLRSLGVVLDADNNMQGKWKKVADLLKAKGIEKYNSNFDLPEIRKEGIVVDFERFKFGLWFWPDNERAGDLETLLEELIGEDNGFELSKTTVKQVLEHKFSLLEEKDSRKAQIYTWLGFQKEPGRPIGLAVKNKYINLFQSDGKTLKNETLILFKSWLQRLYTHDDEKTDY